MFWVYPIFHDQSFAEVENVEMESTSMELAALRIWSELSWHSDVPSVLAVVK